MSIVSQVFSLPVLEPMTPVRLNNIIRVAMSCLYAAISVTMATSVVSMSGSTQQKGSGAAPGKDDEGESASVGIVQKSVSVADWMKMRLTILLFLKQTSRDVTF